MKKKQNQKQSKVGRVLAGILSAALVLSSVPLPLTAGAAGGVTEPAGAVGQAGSVTDAGQEHAKQGADSYDVSFTDGDSRGQWQVASGDGTLGFQDGSESEGYAEFTANGNTVYTDSSAPNQSAGYVEMKITNLVGQERFAIAFRYQDDTHWQGFGFDIGGIRAFKGDGYYSESPLASYSFTPGEAHVVRIEYTGNKAVLLIDGEEMATLEDANIFPEESGTIGIRTWGYDSGDTQGAIQVDYVKAGAIEVLKEVSLSPKLLEQDYDTVAEADVEVKLSDTTPALKDIHIGNDTLVKGQDYTTNGAVVTIKKEYLESVKENAQSKFTFEFDNGYTTDFTFRVKKQEKEFSYSRSFAKGLDGFEKVSGAGTLKEEEGSAAMTGDGIFIDQNSIQAVDTEVEFTFNPKNVSCNYGVILRYVSPGEYLYVGPYSQSNQHYTNWAVCNQNGKVADISDAGFILDGRETPYKVKVRVVGSVVTVFIDNECIYSRSVANITGSAGKVGFRTTSGTGMNVYEFTQGNAVSVNVSGEEVKPAEIKSDQLTVSMDSAFPRVITYTLAGGAVVGGQEQPVYQIEVNNKVYENAKVTSSISGNKAVYNVEIEKLGVSFDVEYTVTGNVLEMKLVNIQDDQNKIYTINFPEQSMVSMSSQKAGAKLRVNNYQAETKYDLSSRTSEDGYGETTLAVLSADDAAAALSGESYKNRKEVAYKTTDCGDHTSTGLWLNEFTYRGVDGEVEIEEPWAKAAVVGDINKDGKIDYQDGAAALRDLCMARKTGADTVTSTWSMVAMNVGSEAQYPFLRILDNIKKISLATDGFGQNVIIKGYQSEGHDASHPDFANYNKRAGGLEDLNTLLQDSENYNAKVGIHINHTDVYPEAPQYGKLASSLGAWSWYDTSMGTIRENDDLDKSENGLDGRMATLFDEDTEGQLDTVYVDVFFGTRWPLYKLVSNINDRNMVLGTEYVDEMVSYSAFAHHIGSNFGGAGNLVRFVDNSQADIFSTHQLFRGTNNRANEQIGIDGWQGAKNLNTALEAFYTMVLPNKYLAQFPIMQYETDNKAVLGENGQVVTEMIDGINVITKDGKRIAEGNKLFIPWDPKEETKIYHYNPAGGDSTWELPDSWSGVKEVKLFELSDEGKTQADTLTVSDGSVTITGAKAGVGYVLYKGEMDTSKELTAKTMEWSTGAPIKDMGFDSHGFQYWKKDEAAENVVIENNNLGNSHLYMKGKEAGEAAQEITGLTPGEAYSASVWAITTDGRKASITVDNGGQVLENYMTRSNVQYGYHHNDKYLTKAQRMSVRFVAEGESAVLTLSAASCKDSASIVDFDDVRVMKCGITDTGDHTYYEDFENVDQGVGIFVSTDTDQSHLSQMNPVDPQYTPDVIDGTYSLKVRAGDYMRTLPSTVRFLPNTTYTVGLEYKSQTANSFKMAIKSDKALEAGDSEAAVLAEETAALGSLTTGTLEVKFTTGDYDDYYLDITKNAAAEYYIDNVYVDEAKPMNVETLTQLAADAAAMKEGDYTPESYKKVQDALSAARAVLAKPEPGRDEIVKAYQDLDAAMGAAVKYAGAEEKKLLSERIENMKGLLPGDYVQDAKWLALQAVIEEAQELQKNGKATVPQVMEMVQRLGDAKNELTPTVDRSKINAVLKKAEAVERNTVVDGQELQTFLSALEEAQTANAKPGVTAKEIQEAADKLENAYNAISLKDESAATLIAEALKKTNVKEEYFQEEDLAVIREVKAQLQKMSQETGIAVKEYYAAMERLEAALENRQDKPVLSDSQKIDPADFALECDNQNPPAGSEGPVELAFDNDPDTFWHSNYTPQQPLPATIIIDMGKKYTINQFTYLCRPSGENGKVGSYDLSYMDDKGEWVLLVTDGTFKNDVTVEKVKFGPVSAQKVRFVVKEGAGGFGSAAELALYEKVADLNKLQTAVSDFEKLDQSLYTKGSFSALETLIRQAEKMLENPKTPQAEADALVQRIQTAKEGLELLPTEADMRALENAVAEAKAVKLEEYKDTKNFVAALAAAEKLLANPTTQKEVNAAALDLIQKKNALVKGEKPVVLPSAVTLDKTSLSLRVFDTAALKAAVTPADAANKTVTWKSSDSRIADVKGGVITALNVGTAKITVSTVNGKSASCTVTVTAVSLANVKVGAIAVQKHTGRQVKPGISLTYGKTALRLNTDYTLSYKNNEKPGTAAVTITGKGQYSGTLKKSFTIAAAKGKTYTVGKGKYKVSSASRTRGSVIFVKPLKKSYSSFSVPSTVKIGNYRYKVTEIGKSAFKANIKLKKVTIGSNVKKIGAYAFYNAKRLKRVTVNSKVLKSIGKNAFKKIDGKAAVKAPKKQFIKYKKLLRGKGLSSKAKITK